MTLAIPTIGHPSFLLATVYKDIVGQTPTSRDVLYYAFYGQRMPLVQRRKGS
jgi:hypothetical protein